MPTIGCLETALRGEMGFQGYTYSHWGGVEFNCGLQHVAADNAGAAEMAINAGVDLEAPGPSCFQHLARLVRERRVSESEIDQAAARVLHTKFVGGLFDGRPDADLAHLARIARAEHVALAQRIAEESIVLLKNDQGLLPLDPANRRASAIPRPVQ